MSLERFIALWMIPDYPPKPVSDEGLRTVEARFGFAFPADYREAVLGFGLVAPTIALLDAIVDGKIDMADLSQLLDPAQMIASTEAWRDMGLPGEMVAFGSDCMGNLFCFSADPGETGRVFFFDHDFGSIGPVAPSFTRWIEAFCALA
jgi:hypothetical protein